jgi:hypothetical protein
LCCHNKLNRLLCGGWKNLLLAAVKMKSAEIVEFIELLKARFTKHINRHKEIDWKKVEEKLLAHPEKITVLKEMDATGGEPDVIGYDKQTNAFIFCDCSAESPIGRRSLCYDRSALESRKENKPQGNAIDIAAAIGIQIMTEQEYRQLQTLGEFDRKTSSWIKTPSTIRDLGGALFCDRRYNQVFVYHNGAESYYAARGFRGILKV